ncbi:ribulose-phosphate 3-epimerase [Anaerotruncus colihominis]|jgi:ribulose-phosphate 3-epimerase|uniref:Ribulose-phosphate 3-epimerase n=2 Tax=Oscillospiraceae TaxID=216572 RepID=A0A845STT1_9FIRM|nr:ribulose-phosphate 3-epimerase [Anaerotruncus colihominis]NDO39926.1 ribulose-phosphate 3-epimerase [Anaerotruncus colihominis]
MWLYDVKHMYSVNVKRKEIPFMNKISPSVMCIDMMDLKNQLARLDAAGVDFYHIDIMDGHFVPNYSLNGDLMRAIKGVSNTPMDVHLMVTNPTEYIQYFVDAGAEIITLHIETLDHPIRALKQIRALGKKAGLAVNPATDISKFKYLLDFLDLVCVMTVDPGFAGQTLIPATVSKISELRAMFDAAGKQGDIDIMVDGQVKEETAQMLVDAGANMLVLGSSGLFKFPPERYAEVVAMYKNLKKAQG